jgi:hypothetical protein
MQNAIVQMMEVAPDDRGLQWLKDSLQAAIELELSTLPPYLCAMWSIRDTSAGSPGATAYKLIDSVVKQEMAHLGLVCNMLTAIGGIPAIAGGYDKNIHYPGHLPGGVRPELTVFLSGLTKSYVHDVLMQIEFPENEIVFEMALAGPTFPTIGAFYDALKAAFLQVAPQVDKDKQLTSSIGVTKFLVLKDVTDAIDLIKSQGEGSSKSPDDSSGELAHYYRFAELYVGSTLVATAGGGFSFSGAPIPFPDTVTMAPIPRGGYTGVSSAVAALLNAFNGLFSGMLDDLDTAWKNIDQTSLTAAIQKMLQLKKAAQEIMAKALPKAANGFYGPNFLYLPVSQRTAAPAAGGPQAVGGPLVSPVFSDITTLLATLTGADPNIDTGSPHGAFWKDDYATFMALKTDGWGVPGNLVVKGDPDHSVLVQALSGTGPFGAFPPQMPDIGSDANGRLATPTELQMVKTWITNNCPK